MLRAGYPIVILLSAFFLILPGSMPGTSLAADKTAEAEPKDAQKFIQSAEQRYGDSAVQLNRASWVKSNFITQDTEGLEASANERNIALVTELAEAASKLDPKDVPPDIARKLKLLRLSLPLPAPQNDAERAELTRIAASMEGQYGSGKYCPDGKQTGCLDLEDLSKIMAENRDAAKLKEVWMGWRTVPRAYRKDYARYVELANKGAREMGFTDVGAMWRSNYDMPPDAFAAEMERLWIQVKPLYDSLHRYVRARLRQKYGDAVVPADGPIPAHLLGNMWAQEWGNIFDVVQPAGTGEQAYDLTKILKSKNTTPKEMVKYGENFFVSLGLPNLPQTFWERSLFTKPADREVVCHPSAWDIDNQQDVRLKMCIDITEEDFNTIHHELGHNYYQMAYAPQTPLFQNSANDGFHEALGDTIALSVTPDYLKQLGFIDHAPGQEADIPLLLKQALDKIAFLPFGYMVDQWRWKVFSGEISPTQYNKAWWDLAEKYQGIAPPEPRTENDFDPGAKYHVAANVPYARYFLATILQFQFHRALCKTAGYTGPLNRCSIFGNKAAGAKLNAMMQMGQSKPWPEALKALTGEDRMDATAILDYFAPLKTWLDQQNAR